jgi:hypothetical protein
LQRQVFDITHISPASFPPEYADSFYNQRWVQEALGVPVNFTLSSPLIVDLFFGLTGDPIRRTMSDLEFLLARGLKVALVYGDRDYRCNWLGAENVSLSVNYPGAASFRKAGYAEITTNGSYVGGLVRQHGNVSFARVFQAGHSVTAYQPETAFRIFDRAMTGRDVATGRIEVAGGNVNYSSAGPLNSFGIKNAAPESPPPVCYIVSASITCAPNQIAALKAGTAVVRDFVVVSPVAEVNGNGGAATNGSLGSPGSENGSERLVGPSVGALSLLCLCIGALYMTI